MKHKYTDFIFHATWIESLQELEEREGKEKAQEVAYFIIKLFSGQGEQMLDALIREYSKIEHRMDEVESKLDNLGV